MTAPARCEGTFTVRAELGLHARPAGEFVALASRFDAAIEVARSDVDEWVDGTSILSLLSLAAARGTRLRIRAVGPDAEVAVRSLGGLIEGTGQGAEPAA